MNILTFLKAVTFKVKTSVVAFWATFGVFGLLFIPTFSHTGGAVVEDAIKTKPF